MNPLTPRQVLTALISFPPASPRSNPDPVDGVQTCLQTQGIPCLPHRSDDRRKAAPMMAQPLPRVPRAVVVSGHCDLGPGEGQVGTSDRRAPGDSEAAAGYPA